MFDHQSTRIVVEIGHNEGLVAAGVAHALMQQADMSVSRLHPSQWPSVHAHVVVLSLKQVLSLVSGDQIRMPSSTGRAPRIMVICEGQSEGEIRRALEAGAQGLVHASSEVEEVVHCVRALAMGTRFVCSSIAQQLAAGLMYQPLTPREQEVLCLLVSGLSNKAIALTMSIACGTVKAHVKNILDKLEARSRAHAVSVATSRGLVSPSRNSELAAHQARGGWASHQRAAVSA